MLWIIILISLFTVIAAISAIISERKRRERANRKWMEFEKRYPPSSGKRNSLNKRFI